MTRADSSEITWGDRDRKHGWTVRIHVGAEVIKRHPEKSPGRDADEASLRSMAVRTANDEGYDLDPAQVVIQRS